MSDEFLEDFDNPLPDEGDNAQASDQASDNAPSGDTVNEATSESVAGTEPKQEETTTRQSTDELLKAREEAAYWRGRFEASGNVQNYPEPPSQLSEEELKRQEDEFLSDPSGYTAKLVKESLNDQFQQYTRKQSVTRMQLEAPDYDQAIAKLQEKAKADPALGAYIDSQLAGHPDPARFAYNYAKRMDTFDTSGKDVNKIKEDLEKELRDKIETELRQKLALEDAGNTTPTPATARGSGGIAPAKKANNLDPLAGNPFD